MISVLKAGKQSCLPALESASIFSGFSAFGIATIPFEVVYPERGQRAQGDSFAGRNGLARFVDPEILKGTQGI